MGNCLCKKEIISKDVTIEEYTTRIPALKILDPSIHHSQVYPNQPDHIKFDSDKLIIKKVLRKPSIVNSTQVKIDSLRTNEKNESIDIPNLLDEKMSKFIESVISNIIMFKVFSKAEKRQVIEYFEPVSYKKDEVIFSVGDIVKYFFVVYEGKVAITDSGILTEMNNGSCFSEEALIESGVHQNEATALTNCILFVCEGATFAKLKKKIESEKSSDKMYCLDRVPLFSCFLIRKFEFT